MPPWTQADCERRITQLQAELDDIVLLPTRVSTGKSALDFSGKVQVLNEALDTWRRRLALLTSGGTARRKERVI